MFNVLVKNIDETEKILYDEIGNPTTYRDATMSWYGRQLTKYKLDKDTEDDTSDDVTFDFTYDADGLRGSKVKEYYVKNEDGNYVAKSEKTVYQYVGDKLYYEKRGDYQEFYYFYDSYGKLSAIYYNFKSPTTGKSSSAVYFVPTNSQGDVIGLYKNKGVKVAAYEYDAWGNILSVIDADGKPIDEWYHIANANPIRYRGYYYDADLGLYYLQSRYYDSTVGRFINADNLVSDVGGDVLGNNMFAYCLNNPVNMSDPSGHWPQWLKNTVKWVAKNIGKPVVKAFQKALSKVDLTYSTGVNVSGTPSAWSFNGQIGVSMDTKGNVAIQASGGGGVTSGTPSISVSSYRSITNAPSINELNGMGYQIGGSAIIPVGGVPVAVGGDFNIIPDQERNKAYYGGTLTRGLAAGSPGGEFHVEWGTTVTLPKTQFNIYDVASSVYIKIMEW